MTKFARTQWFAGFVALAAAAAQDGDKVGGPPKFFGGPPGMQGEAKLVKKHDADGDGRLNRKERDAARAALTKERSQQKGFGRFGGKGGFGPPGGMFGKRLEGKPGRPLTPDEVANYPDKPLFDPETLRTIFLEFEGKDWEAELEAFYKSDVEVPATMTVDGKRYPDVGVHFRGMSSYFTVPTGSKRSLNISLDFVDKDQRLLGVKTLNLLNCHEDASCLSTVLYSTIARHYIPAPKANFVRVVVNGECWGVYASVEQFDKNFLEDNFKTSKGARWKVRGSPFGDGGLRYVGDKVADYERRYELKSGGKDSWTKLIRLCKLLQEAEPAKLETELPKIMDVDGLLWFLALDNGLINCDGYWIRASDYSIYLDPKGKFHLVPHDMNEAFRPGMGPGMGGPPGMGPGRGGPPAGKFNREEFDGKKDGDFRGKGEGKGEDRFVPPDGPPPGFGKDGGPPPGFGPPGEDGFKGKGKGPGGMMGMFFGGGPRRADLDPLVGVDDASKPLRSKVLKVPAFRAQYLRNIRQLAERDLAWKNLGPIVAKYRALLAPELKLDTRKLESFEDFEAATADEPPKKTAEPRPGPPGATNLRQFADERRKFLLDWKESAPAGRPQDRQPAKGERLVD